MKLGLEVIVKTLTLLIKCLRLSATLLTNSNLHENLHCGNDPRTQGKFSESKIFWLFFKKK